MAKSRASLYQGKLELDRVTGIRNDKGQTMNKIPVVKEQKVQQPKIVRKTKSNIKDDQWRV